MCSISRETILRANRRVSGFAPRTRSSVNGDLVVSTRYAGVTFTQSIPMATIRENYGRALQRL